jgi:hypothetical protein
MRPDCLVVSEKEMCKMLNISNMTRYRRQQEMHRLADNSLLPPHKIIGGRRKYPVVGIIKWLDEYL